MANEQLDAFLAEGAAQATAAPEPSPEPREQQPTPEPQKSAEPSGKPQEAAKEGAKQDDDNDPPNPLDGEPIVPRRAFEDERRKRQDWKEKASRAEGELAALKRQLEERQQQPKAEPPPLFTPPPVPFQQNPEAWVANYVQNSQRERLNDRLNMTEEALRDKIGDDKVDSYINDFKQAAQGDPTLYDKMYAQPNPYRWMAKEVERLRTLNEVGDDPAAFRARIAAEERAKWEAETKQAAPQPSPAAGLQPSLATARSVAGRSAPTWTGEPSLEDVLAPVQNRKSKGNGAMVKRF